MNHEENGYEGSGAYIWDIMTAVREMGFYDADLACFELGRAHHTIKEGNPILLRGRKDRGGHVWIADGY